MVYPRSKSVYGLVHEDQRINQNAATALGGVNGKCRQRKEKWQS